ncbi:MAG: glycosyltransferase, partial [Pseudomonadota bacterium]
PLLQAVADRASRIYHVSAWFRPIFARAIRAADEKQVLLPNFIRLDCLRETKARPSSTFLSIMRLEVASKKGIDRLLPAFQRLRQAHPEARLDIVGRGEPGEIRRLESLVARYALTDAVHIKGHVEHETLLSEVPNYVAMALPSHNETFGMAYVEAVLSGIPILYSRCTGIDGYFDDVSVGVGVNPRSVDEIAGGLMDLYRNRDEWTARVRAAVPSVWHRFEAGPYVRAYQNDLNDAIGRGAHEARVTPAAGVEAAL